MIGDVTPNSVKVWVRVPIVRQWQLVLSKNVLHKDIDDDESSSQAAGDSVHSFLYV